MPQRAAHPCAAPGCAELVQSGAWCTTHQPAASDNRPTAHERGYGATWQRLRRIILARDPVCTDPFNIHAGRGEVALSVDVDHIIPRSAGGLDREDNLRGLCHSCHSKRTARAL